MNCTPLSSGRTTHTPHNSASACFLALAVFSALLCASCSTRINGKIHKEGRAELVLRSELLPGMNGLLKSLAPKDSAAPVLDAGLLNDAFARMSGIETAALHNTPFGGVEGRIAAADAAVFFNSLSRRAPAKNAVTPPEPFAVWEQTANGGRLAVSLNRGTGQEFISLVSTDLADYLSALMAPIATGEVIDNDGYLELVSSVYGKTVAEEIGNASISIVLDLPSPVQRATGGTFKGNRAEFAIRLIDALVLDRPLFYEIRWAGL
ncbi:MAG: hypothetical protein LBH50_03435 [Spirochaetaceae bacterium]|jgi:hypothetical protein|nr:hypothetical protein [Spirochaetaceae bacterium]